MHKARIGFLILIGALFFAACGGAPDSGITPAADGLTFLFFYTEG